MEFWEVKLCNMANLKIPEVFSKKYVLDPPSLHPPCHFDFFWNSPFQVLKLLFTVFLTHVGIQQMLMWLPMWKAKSLYHVGTFLPMWFFLPLQKFKTIKIKLEKNTYTQANTCLLHISRNFKDIFKYICFTLYL